MQFVHGHLQIKHEVEDSGELAGEWDDLHSVMENGEPIFAIWFFVEALRRFAETVFGYDVYGEGGIDVVEIHDSSLRPFLL